MKKYLFIIVVLFVFSQCADVTSTDNNNGNGNGNGNGEPEREKWDFFHFDYIYKDELDFNASVSANLQGGWGDKTEFTHLIFIEDISDKKVYHKKSNTVENSIYYSLSNNKLIFYYYYGDVYDKSSAFTTQINIHEKRTMSFDLVAKTKTSDSYFFISEDKQYYFHIGYLGYYMQSETNKISKNLFFSPEKLE
jgi:hypothetical protein